MVQIEIGSWAKQISQIILLFTIFLSIVIYSFNLMNYVYGKLHK